MNEKILVVDDEKEIADVVELYLQNEYHVLKFYTGQEALECIEKTNVDLAILDVMLPDIDGFTIAIIREDLITEDVLPGTPTMLTYKTHADAGSLYNTPPAYGIYICGKVFKWLKKMGGLEVMKERNEKKAKLLYDYLDQSKLFKGTVEKKDRSLMNVPFVTGSDELDAKFVKEAKEAGLENLKGHRTVGGMRASIYNAMPYEGVEALVAFMKKFEEENL